MALEQCCGHRVGPKGLSVTDNRVSMREIWGLQLSGKVTREGLGLCEPDSICSCPFFLISLGDPKGKDGSAYPSALC